MPELPEVETVKKVLEKSIANKIIIDFEIVVKKAIKNVEFNKLKILKGQKILSLHRFAKYLIFELESSFLVFHLRMEGNFNIFEKRDLNQNIKYAIA